MDNDVAVERVDLHQEGPPAATIYAAILREIQKKGDAARFRKAARGKFELAR